MNAGDKIPGEDVRTFIKVAEQLLSRVRPHRTEDSDKLKVSILQLVYEGVMRHLGWEREKIDLCWKLMLELRKRRVPPSLVDYLVVLPNLEVEMHFLQKPS